MTIKHTEKNEYINTTLIVIIIILIMIVIIISVRVALFLSEIGKIKLQIMI